MEFKKLFEKLTGKEKAPKTENLEGLKDKEIEESLEAKPEISPEIKKAPMEDVLKPLEEGGMQEDKDLVAEEK